MNLIVIRRHCQRGCNYKSIRNVILAQEAVSTQLALVCNLRSKAAGEDSCSYMRSISEDLRIESVQIRSIRLDAVSNLDSVLSRPGLEVVWRPLQEVDRQYDASQLRLESRVLRHSGL